MGLLVLLLVAGFAVAETSKDYTLDEAKFVSYVLNQPEVHWEKIIKQNHRILNQELLDKLGKNIQSNLEQNRDTGAWMLALLADMVARNLNKEQIYRLGVAMYYIENKKQYGSALDICQNVLLNNPKNKRVLIVKAQIYEATKNYEAAFYCYQDALKNDPKNDEIYLMVGDLFVKVGEKDKARQAYQKALELDPKGKALLYIDKLEKFNVPQRDKTTDVNPLLENGKQLLQDGQLDEAEKAFQECLKVDPHSSQALAGLASTYIRTYQYDKAIPLLKKGIEEDQLKDPALYRLLGNALEANADKTGVKYFLEQAIEVYEQALKLDPKDTLTKFYLERAREALKKF